MKEIEELAVPDDLRYSQDHEWARREEERVRVGITDYAQDQLGDVVFVELPAVGSTFEAEETFGVVESVKAVSDLLMPVGGEVVEVNENLLDAPQLVNQNPYREGWLIAVRPKAPQEWERLLTPEDYVRVLRGIA